MVDLGVDRAGDVLAEALFRFAARQDPPGGAAADADAVAFAIRFLAHAVWLDLLFAPPVATGPTVPPPATSSGLELAVVLVAAQRLSPALVWPADVPASGDLGLRFTQRLGVMAERVRARRSPRFDAAVALAGLAAESVR